MSDQPVTLDSLLPAAVAAKAENVGVAKGNLDVVNMFMLAILAGAFIGLGAIFCTTVVTGTGPLLGYGVTKMLGGLVFCIGLILVVIAGAELFTGNNLIVMATLSGKLGVDKMIKNWVVVYVGNFVGSVLTAWIMYMSTQYTQGAGQVGLTALNIANSKCGLDFMPALFLGIMCNAMVCLAVWLTFSCRTTGDKILAIIFPIAGFVAAGFEHCVANMYFVPIGLFIKGGAPEGYWTKIGKTAGDFANLTWGNFLVKNLLPVTIGNMIGGVIFVGVIYWIVYLRKRKEA